MQIPSHLLFTIKVLQRCFVAYFVEKPTYLLVYFEPTMYNCTWVNLHSPTLWHFIISHSGWSDYWLQWQLMLNPHIAFIYFLYRNSDIRGNHIRWFWCVHITLTYVWYVKFHMSWHTITIIYNAMTFSFSDLVNNL